MLFELGEYHIFKLYRLFLCACYLAFEQFQILSDKPLVVCNGLLAFVKDWHAVKVAFVDLDAVAIHPCVDDFQVFYACLFALFFFKFQNPCLAVSFHRPQFVKLGVEAVFDVTPCFCEVWRVVIYRL